MRSGSNLNTSGRSIAAALTCASATFLLLFPANMLPLIRISIFGMQGEDVIAAGVSTLLGHGWILLAGLSAIVVIVLPFLRFGLLTVVLGTLWLGYRPYWLGAAFRWTLHLDPWAMLDVYLLAAVVAYYRLSDLDLMHVSIGVGGACFVAAALLTMLSRATLDKRTIWRAIGVDPDDPADEATIACTACDLVVPASTEGQRCPRCAERLHAREPYAVLRTTALLIAALILFFPANFYPMIVTSRLGFQVSYTIFDGIRALFQTGLWPLGIVIFCTSIAIPLGKIFALGWCVLSVRRRSRRHLVAKTKILRAVAELGRWSDTDPFTIVFFVPLMNFGWLTSASPGLGATAFILMAFLTMVASFTFDPRLMWDASSTK